ncbi:hypothetical protein [Nostoc sp.]|uniref:hypothetical protein n=1 Tax=Nostoc sp. TaxID=1180 RepID=UPI002FF8D893
MPSLKLSLTGLLAESSKLSFQQTLWFLLHLNPPTINSLPLLATLLGQIAFTPRRPKKSHLIAIATENIAFSSLVRYSNNNE